jgi:hypothetical protein
MQKGRVANSVSLIVQQNHLLTINEPIELISEVRILHCISLYFEWFAGNKTKKIQKMII